MCNLAEIRNSEAMAQNTAFHQGMRDLHGNETILKTSRTVCKIQRTDESSKSTLFLEDAFSAWHHCNINYSIAA